MRQTQALKLNEAMQGLSIIGVALCAALSIFMLLGSMAHADQSVTRAVASIAQHTN